MKKLFVILLTVLLMSVCVLAQTEGETFTLTEYLDVSGRKDSVEYIYMYSERTYNSGVDLYVSPDADEFLTLADSIILTDVEDTPMKFYEEGNITPRDSLCIEVHFDDGEMTFALISALGEVDKYSLMMSRLPAADCVTDKENFLKLEEIYDELMNAKREELSAPYKSLVYGDETFQVAESESATEENAENKPSDEEKEPQYNGVALIVVVAVMATAVALTLVLTKKKK